MKYVERASTRQGLGDLAEKINQGHRRSEGASGVEKDCHAIRAGELLIEAKAGCPHGSWQGWLEKNFEGSV